MQYSQNTVIEMYYFMEANAEKACGLDTEEQTVDFIAQHAACDLIHISRADDGKIRGLLFGWPIHRRDDYDGEYVEEPDGDTYYVNMFVARKKLMLSEFWPTSAQALRDSILHRHGSRLKNLCFHRGKHSDRFQMMPFNQFNVEKGM